MYTALGMLGYKSYHCAQIRFDPAGTYALWNEGLRAKYRGQGKRYGKAEFDKLLGQYEVCLCTNGKLPVRLLTDALCTGCH